MSSLYLLGAIYNEMGQKEKAKLQFYKILAVQPNHDGALNSLAYIYAEEESNLDEALKMARKAVDLEPSSGAYYDTLGWVLFKQGFHAESLMALEKALNYVSDPLIYEHMGDVYKSKNNLSLARKFWLKSLALESKQPKLSEKLQQLSRFSAKMQESVELNLTK
jgi:Tfp pilus assembly protein PilF